MDQELLDQANERFWAGFLARLRDSRASLEFHIHPTRSHMLVSDLPTPGFSLVFIKMMDSVSCEVRKPAGVEVERWRAAWMSLPEIPGVSGLPVRWGFSIGLSWVGFRIRVKGYRALEDATWPAVYDAMVEQMERFLDAVGTVTDLLQPVD